MLKQYLVIVSLAIFVYWSKGQTPQWTVYDTSNSGIGGNDITSITKDANGNKWVGKFDGGIAKFDGVTWTTYDTAIASASLYVMDIAVDHSNNIWVATQADGVLKFNGSHWTVFNSTNSGLTDDRVWTVAIDNSGVKWFGTLLHGISKFDDTAWTGYDMSNSSISATQIETIEIDKRNRVNIGTAWGGYDLFDGTNWTIVSTSNSLTDDIHCIEFDLDSSKWFGTHGGAILLDSSNTNSTIYDMSNSAIPSNDIHSVGVAADGTKWIGTENEGLAKFDGINWTTYGTSNSGIPSDWVGDILIDDDGSIWLATRNGVAVLRFITSINSINDDSKPYSLFANPFSSELTFNLTGNEPTTISLYNFLGQQVLQQAFTNSIKINTEQLADGIYFYELRNERGLIGNGKVIKQ